MYSHPQILIWNLVWSSSPTPLQCRTTVSGWIICSAYPPWTR